MSSNTCFGAPNNVYTNFPGIVEDGSLFTSYQPAGQENLMLKKAAGVKSNNDYKTYLQKNATSIMEHNRKYAHNFNCYFTYVNDSSIETSGNPYMFENSLDKSRPIGYSDSDLKNIYLSRNHLNNKL